MLYAYAITRPGDPPDSEGLGGAALRAVGEGGLVAIVSEHDELPLRAEPEDLWAHEAVVEAAMKSGPVLPMRIGTSLRGERELLDALRARAPQFRRALERVEGAVELGIRAVVDVAPSENGTPVTGAGPGTAYMLGRLERVRAAERVAAAIHEPLAALARESTWRVEGGQPPRLAGAYLVDRSEVDRFRERVADLEDGRPIAIVCTGPWPPYSFVSEEEER
jgi:hypothetical protein